MTTPHCKISPDPDSLLPRTEEYAKKRRNPPRGGPTQSYMRSLLRRADEMGYELLNRIAVMESTLSELALMRPGDPAPRPLTPTPASLWLKEDAADPTRDPGGTP